MGSYALLSIGSLSKTWKNEFPEVIALFFDPSDYRSIYHESELWCEHKFVTTCGRALERIKKHGITLESIKEIFFKHYDFDYDWHRELLLYRCEAYIRKKTDNSQVIDPKQAERMADLILAMYFCPLDQEDRFDRVVKFYRDQASQNDEESNQPKKKELSEGEIKNHLDYLHSLSYQHDYLLEFIREDPFTYKLKYSEYYDLGNGSYDLDEFHFIVMPILSCEPEDPLVFDFTEFTGSNLPMNQVEATVWLNDCLLFLHERILSAQKLFGQIDTTGYSGQESTANFPIKQSATAQEKGDFLEELVHKLFTNSEGFVVNNKVRRPGAEIDLVVLNKVNDPFWFSLQSPLIIIECRNKKGKVEPKELRDFEIKMLDRKGLCRLGIVVSPAGFTKGCYETIARSSRDGHRIVLVDNGALKKRFDNNESTVKWLEELIISQF
jgi:hypothetical protein